MSRLTKAQWASRNQNRKTRHPGSKRGYHGDVKHSANVRRWLNARKRSTYLEHQIDLGDDSWLTLD